MRRVVAVLATVALILGAGGDTIARGAPMSQAAHDYLERALTLLQDNALDRHTVDWRKIRIDAFDMARAGHVAGTNPVRLTNPAPPVAVLTSQYTGRAREGTLVSFLGLDRVRTFGLRTAGLSTSNEAYELSDGAILVLTTATMADRTERRYGKSIEPDVTASPRTGADVAAATTWLANQPGCS